MIKKILIKVFSFIFAATLIVSCSPTVKVTSDYDRNADFSAYKTFSVYNLTTAPNVNLLNAERIWNSIRKEMIRKGYKENDHNADLLVNAFSVLKDKKYVAATGNGLYRPYWGTASTTFHAYDYKDGTLIIDVLDAKTNRLVWQGTGSAELNKRPKNPDEAIGNAVARIIADFPTGAEQINTIQTVHSGK